MTTGGSHSSHGHARPPASKPRLLWLQSLHREMAGAGSPFKGKEYHPSSFPHPTQANAPLSYQRPQGTIGVQSSTSLTEHQRARHPDRRWGHSRKQTTCCVPAGPRLQEACLQSRYMSRALTKDKRKLPRGRLLSKCKN